MSLFDRSDRLDIFIHMDGTALSILNAIKQNTERIMATQAEILQKLADANASLDGIQSDITALKALVDGGADLTAISDAVNALADKAAGIDSQT
jgi:hypothetical protein